MDKSAYTGCANGMPKNWLVDPEVTPATVAPSKATVGAARACTGPAITRPRMVERTKNDTLLCNMIGNKDLRMEGQQSYCG